MPRYKSIKRAASGGGSKVRRINSGRRMARGGGVTPGRSVVRAGLSMYNISTCTKPTDCLPGQTCGPDGLCTGSDVYTYECYYGQCGAGMHPEWDGHGLCLCRADIGLIQ